MKITKNQLRKIITEAEGLPDIVPNRKPRYGQKSLPTEEESRRKLRAALLLWAAERGLQDNRATIRKTVIDTLDDVMAMDPLLRAREAYRKG